MQRSFLCWIVLIPALSSLSEAQNAQSDTLATPPFAATARRAESSVDVVLEGEITVFDITSAFGIDQAIIQRLATEWPKKIQARLHLAGLESFKAGNGAVDVEWSVASSGDNPVRVALWKGMSETLITPDSSYWTAVDIVSDKRKIPLKDGYFDILLPAMLFEGNPGEITLQWVDFYR